MTDHSITVHPLRPLLSPDEWEDLRRQVQYVEVSWPVSFVVQSAEPAEESDAS